MEHRAKVVFLPYALCSMHFASKGNAMLKGLTYWALFLTVLAGCAGDPVRVHLPPTHPADRRAEELEFWTIPNPFAGTPEGAAADAPADKTDDSAPSQHHGHGPAGTGHPMPEGGKSDEGGGPPHHMQHGQ
jgi:hypothetical protein